MDPAGNAAGPGGRLAAWRVTAGADGAGTVSRWRTYALVSGLLAVGAWLSWLLPATVVVWAGAHRLRITAQRNRARAAAADRAANLVSLVELALHGGVTLRRALRDVLPWVEPPLGPALTRVLVQVAGGSALIEELEVLVKGPHPELEALWRLIRTVERDGAPAAPALTALAAEGRLERRHRLERSARRLPLRLLVPLLGGVLPAFVLLAVVPMMAGAFAGLRSP